MQTTHRVYFLAHPFWCFRSTPSSQLTVTHRIDCDPRSSTTRRLRVSGRPRTHAHAPQAIKGHVTTLACGQVFPFMPPLSLQRARLARLIYSNPHLLCSVCCYLFTIDFFFWPLILISVGVGWLSLLVRGSWDSFGNRKILAEDITSYKRSNWTF